MFSTRALKNKSNAIAAVVRKLNGRQRPSHNINKFSTNAQKSWVPTENTSLQKVTTQALVYEVSLEQMTSSNTVVPWFLQNMPAAYFRQVPEVLRKQHIKAIVAIRELSQNNLSLKIETKTEYGFEITFISTNTNPGALHTQIGNLVVPENTRLSNVKVFCSLDNELGLNIFSFENKVNTKLSASSEDSPAIFEYVQELRSGASKGDGLLVEYSEAISEQQMKEYLPKCSPSYVAQVNDPKRFLMQKLMFDKVKGTESVSVAIDQSQTEASGSWITIAAANVLPEVLLRSISFMAFTRNFSVVRVNLDTVADIDNYAGPDMPGYVTMLRVLLTDTVTNSSLDLKSENVKNLLNDIRRSKWLDDEVVDLGLKRFPSLGIEKAEIITAYCSMLHGPLSKQSNEAFASVKSVVQVITSNAHTLSIAESLAQLFMDRFRPTRISGKEVLTNEIFQAQATQIENKIDKLPHPSSKIVLNKMLDAIKVTLRTNFYNEDRYALSMRVHPSIMATGNMGQSESKPMPFGVLFVHGRHFNGFHCRFRDIARGGLRIVTPNNSDQHALESSRQFDEAYGLSYAQQLKNKDIPEGGAKAVILVNSPSIELNKRSFAMRKCVKAMTDGILDLTVKDSVAGLVDLYGKDELIYLGPDEQVIPFDIDWICNRAAQRGYPIPAAFMSSKQGAGINHKQYGVTSEGVVVYLDVALNRVLNIDPYKQPFTIKITGGPDGDVAGNLIKILFREYGNNCKVVGIADGFGVAEDPNGLNAEELLRLFEEALPITSFNPSKLSPTGISLNASTEEGAVRRNTMHFRVKSDIFVPAGGRPNTIHADNWRQFLDSDGAPTSSLIVEGANIFTTPEARELLFKHANVKIVKDSSANKCGVITSSCEVAASMLLSKEEFLSAKDELVADVLVRVKNLARLEAELLFREYKHYPGNLPHFSERISNAIGKVTDAITDHLQDVNPGDDLFNELLPLVKENLPKKLADIAWDRAEKRFPVQYQKNAIASTLASKLVYQEGIHLVETQPVLKVAERAIQYYREEQAIQKLVTDFETSKTSLSSENSKTIIDLLKRGGSRTKLGIF